MWNEHYHAEQVFAPAEPDSARAALVQTESARSAARHWILQRACAEPVPLGDGEPLDVDGELPRVHVRAGPLHLPGAERPLSETADFLHCEDSVLPARGE